VIPDDVGLARLDQHRRSREQRDARRTRGARDGHIAGGDGDRQPHGYQTLIGAASLAVGPLVMAVGDLLHPKETSRHVADLHRDNEDEW
jgi:hypothetical protein